MNSPPALPGPVAAAHELAKAVPELIAAGGRCERIGRALLAYLDPRSDRRLEELLGLAVIGQGGETWRAAARRAERDFHLLAAAEFIVGSRRQRAAALVREIRRYESRWLRIDRHRAGMPAEYAGTIRAHLFAAFAAGEPVPTGLTKLAEILSAENDSGILIARFPISAITDAGMVDPGFTPEPPMLSNRTPDTATVIDAIRDTPQVKQALAERDAAVVMQRRGLVAELRKLDREADTQNPKLWAARDAAVEGVKAVEKALLAARQKLSEAAAAVSSASVTHDRRRTEIEVRLREGADNSLIDRFRSEMLDDMDLARKHLESQDYRRRNPITGKSAWIRKSNADSINRRVSAMMEAIGAAEELRFEPDQSTVPAKLQELRDSLPAIERLNLTEQRENA